MSGDPTVLLPSNATAFERAADALADARLMALDADAVRRAKGGAGLAEAPAALLPWLAWEESVDVWSARWSEARKRAAIALSWQLHRTKGTRAAIEAAIAALGLGARISEWHEHDGAPYTFRILADLPPGEGLTAEELGLLWQTALAHKNVRSWIETITLAAAAPPAGAHIGCAVRLRARLRHSYEPFTALATATRAYAGCAATSRQTIRLH